ncbi:hypothetical protein DCC81_03895 [Chitinophaga parva]|uniref:YozE SAM-like domain-containing protein n=1 Tax=Chitinophaga parva TaxID=2169414 RepID=A0A2T7BLV2_9BACT|nr:YozE family protein [Chitinophaga parva]PUZ28636.1 hypothetical protein DCC81_03895 [Chitinophaga parva]
MSLIDFAKAIIDEPSPLGDLARDMQGDYEFPVDKTDQEILSYLRFKTSRQGNEEVVKEFAAAYRESAGQIPPADQLIASAVVFNAQRWQHLVKYFRRDKVVLVGKPEDIYKAYVIDYSTGKAIAFHLHTNLSNLNKIQIIEADGVPDGQLSRKMDPDAALVALQDCPYVYNKPNPVVFDGLVQMLSFPSK